MKKLNSKFLMVILLASMVAILSCDGEEELSTSDKMKKILIGDGDKTWKLKSVTVDNTDQTAKFSDMTIKFSETDYTTTNGGLIWPSPGTWEFTDSNAKAFYRGDGIEVQVISYEPVLALSLEWTKTTYGKGGRVSSISGQHIFVFDL